MRSCNYLDRLCQSLSLRRSSSSCIEGCTIRRGRCRSGNTSRWICFTSARFSKHQQTSGWNTERELTCADSFPPASITSTSVRQARTTTQTWSWRKPCVWPSPSDCTTRTLQCSRTWTPSRRKPGGVSFGCSVSSIHVCFAANHRADKRIALNRRF